MQKHLPKQRKAAANNINAAEKIEHMYTCLSVSFSQ
jgi:hypothetical protein